MFVITCQEIAQQFQVIYLGLPVGKNLVSPLKVQFILIFDRDTTFLIICREKIKDGIPWGFPAPASRGKMEVGTGAGRALTTRCLSPPGLHELKHAVPSLS